SPRADLGKGSARRRRLPIIIIAPASDSAIASQPAGMVTARADLGEGARGWCRLPIIIVSPAGDSAIASQPSGRRPACSDWGDVGVATAGWAEGIACLERREGTRPVVRYNQQVVAAGIRRGGLGRAVHIVQHRARHAHIPRDSVGAYGRRDVVLVSLVGDDVGI